MKLADWLSQNDRTDTWLAEQVGRERSFITKVKNGQARPSIEVAAQIQRITDGAVTAVDYVPEPEGTEVEVETALQAERAAS